MGKASRRKQHAYIPRPGFLHDQIVQEAAELHQAEKPGFAEAKKARVLRLLLKDALSAIKNALPHSIEFEGRTYWLRSSIGLARVEVFHSPTTETPLCTGLLGSLDEVGQNPTRCKR
jgi:hypothetical protein